MFDIQIRTRDFDPCRTPEGADARPPAQYINAVLTGSRDNGQ